MQHASTHASPVQTHEKSTLENFKTTKQKLPIYPKVKLSKPPLTPKRFVAQFSKCNNNPMILNMPVVVAWSLKNYIRFFGIETRIFDPIDFNGNIWKKVFQVLPLKVRGAKNM